MRKLEDFKDEINKCSKCGLCQSVCPVYKETGNDCAVSRGKFVMLDGVLKGDLELNKNINKYLDLCLKCNKCKDFCPSSIDICDIFTCAKSEYFKKSTAAKFISFIQSRFVFNSMIDLGDIFSSPFRKNFKKKGTTKLLYFKGCFNDIFPKVENAVKKVLMNYDVEIIEKNFDCCGLPFLSSGNIERFLQSIEHNLSLIPDDFDYFITDCASCAHAIQKYKKYTDNAKIDKIISKSINIAEFIAKNPKKFSFKKPVKITFHKPCHMKNIDFLKPILENCGNVEYIEMKDYDACCGFGGEFAIKNNKLSRAISKRKAQNIKESGADIVLTSCPGCAIGIRQGFLKQKTPKIMNIVEFLAMAKTSG